MWQVSSANGARWVRYDGPGRIDASDGMLMFAAEGTAEVEYPAMSGRRHTGPAELVTYLRARLAVGDNGAKVTGTPPAVPAPPAFTPGRGATGMRF